jgi:predicted Rossmann-fold nucleotide-binding protein
VSVNDGFLRADTPCVFGGEAASKSLEYAEWKEVLSVLGEDDWTVVGSLLFTGGGWGGISEWTVGVGSVSCSLVFPLVVCGGVLPSPWWAEPNKPPDLITLRSYTKMALRELVRGGVTT